MGCAPELSAQFITAATGRPRDILNLLPLAPPRPRLDAILTCKQQAKSTILLLTAADASWAGWICMLRYSSSARARDCQMRQAKAADLGSRQTTMQAAHLPLSKRR